MDNSAQVSSLDLLGKANHQDKECPQVTIKLQVKALTKLQFAVSVCLGDLK